MRLAAAAGSAAATASKLQDAIARSTRNDSIASIRAGRVRFEDLTGGLRALAASLLALVASVTGSVVALFIYCGAGPPRPGARYF